MSGIAQWALDLDDSGPVAIIPPKGKDYSYVTYQYAKGITKKHENFGKDNAVRFIGSKGQIDVQRGKLETSPGARATQMIGPNEQHMYSSEDHYKNWLNAIRAREKPICEVEIGHCTATVCTLGNIANELNRPLQWNPRKEKFKADKEANALRFPDRPGMTPITAFSYRIGAWPSLPEIRNRMLRKPAIQSSNVSRLRTRKLKSFFIFSWFPPGSKKKQ